jgi:hypothetical protein
MSIENPLKNPEQGRFSRMPSEGKNKQEKQKMDEKMEQANKRMAIENRKKEEQEETANVKFLREHEEIGEIISQYEEKLGNAFLEQRQEIIKNLREFADKKTGVNLDDPKEKQALEETLKEKLVDEVKQKFNPAM